jgi:hypothetical protein
MTIKTMLQRSIIFIAEIIMLKEKSSRGATYKPTLSRRDCKISERY